jgi:hypothetical protein
MGDMPWRELYGAVWQIILSEERKRAPRGADVRAARRAADLIEKIRVSIDAVVTERTSSGDESSDELRQGILDSIVFSPQFALMLARQGLETESRRRRVY